MSSDDPKLPKAPKTLTFPEERVTGIICFACAGEGTVVEETATNYRAKKCRWCDDGVMSPEQSKAWKARFPGRT